MNNGTISGNTANDNGGGVFGGWGGTFNMRGGIITGNTANNMGGGVWVSRDYQFNKSGGTITGYANDTNNGNRALLASQKGGHAIYSIDGRKENTVGPAANLSYNYGRLSGVWDSDNEASGCPGCPAPVPR